MKKDYKKPQVVEVKLTIQNPILGNCHEGSLTAEYAGGFGSCGNSSANCDQVGN